MDRTTYGLDIAKRVMQVYWVDHQTGEIGKRALKRSQLMLFFGRRPGARIVLEACGSGHYWARQLSRLGHEVRLIHAKRVRPFVRGNKNDAADAQAIWVAAQQPEVRWVPLKSEEQQAVLSLHRVRSQWIKVRTQMVNGLRGLLYEFGVVLPGGRLAGLKAISTARAEIEQAVPALMRPVIDGQLQALREVDARIEALQAQLQGLESQLPTARRVRQIPGVGLLGSTALAGVLGADARGYRSGREFAACLGLVPTPPRYRRQGHRGWPEPSRRPLPADPLDPRRTLGNPPRQAAIAVARTDTGTATQERGGRGAGQQARTAWALVAHSRDYQAGGFAQTNPSLH